MTLFGTIKNESQYRRIPIEKIMPNPMQPRKNFDNDAINTLSESISRYGLIQPISVRVCDGKYELVAGERRLRAAKLAGLCEIPCLVVTASSRKSAELAMVENIERVGLDIFEEAEAIERLLASGDCTQTQLAKRLCMSQSNLANKLRLLRFDEDQRALIRKYKLTERHARTILRVPPEKRVETLKKIGEAGMSVTASEELVDRILCTKLIKAQFEKKKKVSQKEKDNKEEIASVSQGPIRTIVMKDLTLFYNSLERSLSMLRLAGFEADFEKKENDDSVLLSITLKNKK